MFPPSAIMNRRAMLKRLGMGMGAVGLGDLLAGQSMNGTPHFAPKAKRVIHFFLNGGPSHVDTFDPKPLLNKYDGQPLPGGPSGRRGRPSVRRSVSRATDRADWRSANSSQRRPRMPMTLP
jgi:hypothetical protein